MTVDEKIRTLMLFLMMTVVVSSTVALASPFYSGADNWCASDGDYAQCYYHDRSDCEEAAERGEWCEPNPKVAEDYFDVAEAPIFTIEGVRVE